MDDETQRRLDDASRKTRMQFAAVLLLGGALIAIGVMGIGFLEVWLKSPGLTLEQIASGTGVLRACQFLTVAGGGVMVMGPIVIAG